MRTRSRSWVGASVAAGPPVGGATGGDPAGPNPVAPSGRSYDGCRALWLMVVALAFVIAPPLRADEADFARARTNAEAAADVLSRCHRFVEGWLRYRDPATGLLPQNLQSPLWTPENSAADNYPFMVLSCYWTGQALLDGPMRDILNAEILRTTRVRSLPDTVALGTGAWARPTLDRNALIFGAAEYCKDGLLPVAELMGRGVWFERLRQMAHDLCLEAPVETDFGLLPSDGAEVNGECLQMLCRLYRATGDPVMLDMVRRIADAYFVEVLPRNNGLPCHVWDFAQHRPRDARLSLNDHGNEIIGGLSEAVLLLRDYSPPEPAAAGAMRPEAYAQCRATFLAMIDRLLEIAVDEHGVWRGMVDTATGTASGGPPDTWGYAMNAVYVAYLLTGDVKYRAAVRRALRGICYTREWNGADSYADSIESGLVLLNRIPVAETFRWVEEMVGKMSAIQHPDGIIEGWHGDGNVARSWLMVAMWKTGGVRAVPWREDLRYGACLTGDRMYVTVWADRPWQGRLYFDRPRHREHLNLEDYPRLNQFAEWYPVEAASAYEVTQDGRAQIVTGVPLREGWPVSVQPGQTWQATIRHLADPPLAVTSVVLQGKGFIAGTGEKRYALAVRVSGTEPRTVTLAATSGVVTPAEVVVSPDQPLEVEWRGTTEAGRSLILTAQCEGEVARAIHEVLVVEDPQVLDLFRCEPLQEYQGTGYTWLNLQDITCTLDTQGERNVVLSLLWGAKGDERQAALHLGDVALDLKHGGYNGFQWWDIPVPPAAIVDGKVSVRLAKPAEGKIAFVSQIKLKRAAPPS